MGANLVCTGASDFWETLSPSGRKMFCTPARQLSVIGAHLTSVHGALVCKIKGQRKHINFFDINFLAPNPKSPILGPRKQKESLCASIPGKGRKKGTHINFFAGDFWGQKRGPKRAIFSHKKFSLLLFPALRDLL